MSQPTSRLFMPSPDDARPQLAALEMPTSPSTLLQATLDIILLILDNLHDSPESIIALALTCKSLFSLLLPKAPALCKSSWLALSNLLERDFADRFYSCQWCYALHPFSPDWNPETSTFTRMWRTRCKFWSPKAQIFILDGRYKMDYHHLRLVMNRHFYGPSQGLPLWSLNGTPLRMYKDSWKQFWSAQIIDDELFLRVAHYHSTLWTGYKGGNVRYTINDVWPYRLCSHTSALGKDIPALSCTQTSDAPYDTFTECDRVINSCRRCLTDFVTTIVPIPAPVTSSTEECATPMERVQRLQGLPPRKGWIIAVIAYYQFGKGRSPEDWKWRSMVGHRDAYFRNFNVDPAGAIRKRWLTSIETKLSVDKPLTGLN